MKKENVVGVKKNKLRVSDKEVSDILREILFTLRHTFWIVCTVSGIIIGLLVSIIERL